MTDGAHHRQVRWTTTDRGFRHYAEADGHEVRESSRATSPSLWVDGEHLELADAAALRDTLPDGPWRSTLSLAIDEHYQLRNAS
jgi:hypothetical protein